MVAMEVVGRWLLWRWLGGGCYGGGRAVVARATACSTDSSLSNLTYVTPVVVSAAGHVCMGFKWLMGDCHQL